MSNIDVHSFSRLKYEHFKAMSKTRQRIFKFISIFKNQHGNKMVEIFSLDAVVKC